MKSVSRITTIRERMLIGSLLPERGHVADLLILRELESALSFTAAEHEQLKLRNIGNGVVQWDETMARQMTKEIPFPPRAVEIIAERLRQLDQDGQLHKDYLDLYEWFIEANTANVLESEAKP